MKRILVLLVFLFFLAVIFHGSPGNIGAQEEKDDVQDEGVTVLPPDMIIKDIQVGWKNRSVLTRKAKGIDDIEIPVRDPIITFHIYRSQKYSGNYVFKIKRSMLVVLDESDIKWLKSDRNYVNIHTGERTHRIRETLSNMEARLDPGKFAGINRSTIINTGFIKEMQPMFRKEYVIIFKTGEKFILNKGYYSNLLNKNFCGVQGRFL